MNQKEEFGTSITVIVKDLTEERSVREIYDAVHSKSLTADYLINNAGFGGYGYFHERDIENLNSMMKGKLIAITDPGIRFAFRWLMPLVGRRARMKAVRKVMESR